MAGVPASYNSVYLFLKYRYSEHEPIPFVEYIDVEWKNKNTVKLKVYDKNIIGCTSFMSEYVYFDKDGYAFVNVKDVENKRVCIFINKFKRIHDLI